MIAPPRPTKEATRIIRYWLWFGAQGAARVARWWRHLDPQHTAIAFKPLDDYRGDPAYEPRYEKHPEDIDLLIGLEPGPPKWPISVKSPNHKSYPFTCLRDFTDRFEWPMVDNKEAWESQLLKPIAVIYICQLNLAKFFLPVEETYDYWEKKKAYNTPKRCWTTKYICHKRFWRDIDQFQPWFYEYQRTHDPPQLRALHWLEKGVGNIRRIP